MKSPRFEGGAQKPTEPIEKIEKNTLDELVLKELKEDFKGKTDDEIVLELQRTANGRSLMLIFFKEFPDVDTKTLFKLLRADTPKLNQQICDRLEALGALDGRVANKLINFGQNSLVLDNVDRFKGFKFDKRIAIKLLSNSGLEKGIGTNGLLKYPFEGLDREVALIVIQKGQIPFVMEHTSMFEGLVWDRTLALDMVSLGKGNFVIKNPERFEGLVLDGAIVRRAIDSGMDRVGNIRAVYENLNKFIGLSPSLLEEINVVAKRWRVK